MASAKKILKKGIKQPKCLPGQDGAEGCEQKPFTAGSSRSPKGSAQPQHVCRTPPHSGPVCQQIPGVPRPLCPRSRRHLRQQEDSGFLVAELRNPAAVSASQRAAPRFAALRLQDTPGPGNAGRAASEEPLKEGQRGISDASLNPPTALRAAQQGPSAARRECPARWGRPCSGEGTGGFPRT